MNSKLRVAEQTKQAQKQFRLTNWGICQNEKKEGNNVTVNQ